MWTTKFETLVFKLIITNDFWSLQLPFRAYRFGFQRKCNVLEFPRSSSNRFKRRRIFRQPFVRLQPARFLPKTKVLWTLLNKVFKWLLFCFIMSPWVTTVFLITANKVLHEEFNKWNINCLFTSVSRGNSQYRHFLIYD